MGRAIPFGAYDLAPTRGWVSVAMTPIPPRSPVATIGRCWAQMGWHRYPDATRLFVCADASASNGYRLPAWQLELARLAAETGLEITACRFPPGTSMWNQIDQLLANTTTKKR